jgi:hypothetical protein
MGQLAFLGQPNAFLALAAGGSAMDAAVAAVQVNHGES